MWFEAPEEAVWVNTALWDVTQTSTTFFSSDSLSSDQLYWISNTAVILNNLISILQKQQKYIITLW